VQSCARENSSYEGWSRWDGSSNRRDIILRRRINFGSFIDHFLVNSVTPLAVGYLTAGLIAFVLVYSRRRGTTPAAIASMVKGERRSNSIVRFLSLKLPCLPKIERLIKWRSNDESHTSSIHCPT
jgi:hypothetical protein